MAALSEASVAALRAARTERAAAAAKSRLHPSRWVHQSFVRFSIIDVIRGTFLQFDISIPPIAPFCRPVAAVAPLEAERSGEASDAVRAPAEGSAAL